MIIVNPNQVDFMSPYDIIDYVNGGLLPPTKKQYEELKFGIRNALPTDEYLDKFFSKKRHDSVLIEQRAFDGIDKQTFEDLLDHIYEENVKRRNIILAEMAIGVVIGLGIMFKSGKHLHEEDE